MEYMILRIIALFLIVMVCVIDVSYLEFISKIEWQVILGTLIVAFILFADAITGLLFGLLFLVTYLRYYMVKLGINVWDVKYNKYPMNSLVTSNYITEQNLKDAQDNTFNKNAKEYVGVKGVYGEPVYSSQGSDKFMPGISQCEEMHEYAPVA